MWKPFWFESNQVWGECTTRLHWENMKLIYTNEHRTIDLSKIMVTSYIDIEIMQSGERLWNFGTRREYTGDYSLEDFSKEYNLNL